MGFLRVLLAFSVLLEHIGIFPLTNGKFVGGVVAVQGFFLISGFYMALVLNEKYKEPKSFYINRLLRLYPTYWIVLVMTILVTLLFGNELFLKNILNADWSVGSKLLMIISNIFIVGSDWMMFLYPGENGLQFTSNFMEAPIKLYSYHMLPQAWTLPLEMMFYAIAPLIIKNKKMLLAIVAVSLICRYVVSTFIGTNDPWNYRFFPSELIFFTIGALSYYSYTTISRFKYSFSIGVAFFIFITLYIINFDNIPVFLWNSMVFTGQHLQFYILFAFSIPFIFLITKSNSFDRYIGELSYPIYISHILIISLVSHLPKITYSIVYNVIIYTLVISCVINHVLQNPIERIFKRKAQMLNKPNLDSLNLSNSIIK